MINKPTNWSQRLLYLTGFVIIGSIISIAIINSGAHFIVPGLIILLAGVGLGRWISNKGGVLYMYILAAFTAVLFTPSAFNDIRLSYKETISLNTPKDVPGTDGAIYQFSDARVEKEKYGYYLYSYRGHTGYFAAPVVEEGWTPSDPVFVWAVIEARDTPYDSLIFGSESTEGIQADSVTAINESDTSSITLDYPDNNPTTGVYFTGWNTDYKKGAVVNDELPRYFEAVKDAETKHGLVSAKNPLLINWMDKPEESLQDQREVSIMMFIFMMTILAIWFVVMEINIARDLKRNTTLK